MSDLNATSAFSLAWPLEPAHYSARDCRRARRRACRDCWAQLMYRLVKAFDMRSSGRESAQMDRMARKAGKKMRQATTTRMASAIAAAKFGCGAQCGRQLNGKEVMGFGAGVCGGAVGMAATPLPAAAT